ncbi:MAG: S-adenosylmethionine:tRNA ribosyltransferase-isomerase, partial [Desulfofustis sp.]
ERASEIDRQLYQTIYSDQPGAVAAPTAGLHFTGDLLSWLKDKGVETTAITLHVGYGTFAPVQEENIVRHRIHREYAHLSADTAALVNNTKSRGKTIWAVGTTTVRALEFAADAEGLVTPFSDWCDLYITPGYSFRVIDNLITNFHLPCSSLLFLVSALCGRQTLLDCYQRAIEQDYRFYSYGDAMAIVR